MPRLISVLTYIWWHPLNKGRRLAAVRKFLAWQVCACALGGRLLIRWIEDAYLLLGRGETGLTGNLYCGLMEFEDMAFALHVLRPTDVFVDVGANAGAYSILASKVVGARSIAFEPVPSTYQRLLDQLHVNHVTSRVETVNSGVGSAPGKLAFTTDHDTVNRVARPGNADSVIEVDVVSLDSCIAEDERYLLKIDVEGYESEVLDGASKLLASGKVYAVIMELNGSGTEYGYSDEMVHDKLLKYGYFPVAYDPHSRSIRVENDFHRIGGNTIYVLDLDETRQLCSSSPSRRVHSAFGVLI